MIARGREVPTYCVDQGGGCVTTDVVDHNVYLHGDFVFLYGDYVLLEVFF